MATPARSSAWRERVWLTLALVAAVYLLAESGWLWRGDYLAYDASLELWSQAPPDDLVIVAVDEASLAEIGGWPWPRSVHAELVDQLAAEGARVIAIDFIFAEPDARDPANDEALAAAIERAGNVVLPLLTERQVLGGHLYEQLPVPALAGAAAGLAHIHVELDADGVARSVFLRAGLGRPQWPAFALAAYEAEVGRRLDELPGLRTPNTGSSMQQWVRDYWIRVPFMGPPGTVSRMSYINALTGAHPPDIFRDKTVLVGVTAAGLGDSLPTPVSAHQARMPGVEFHANALQALRAGTAITPLSDRQRLAISVALALLPAWVYSLLGPGRALVAAALLAVAPAALSLTLLRAYGLWFAPAPATLVLVASYPLWSWLRLGSALRFLSSELTRLRAEQERMPETRRPSFGAALRFLAEVFPVTGSVLIDPAGVEVRREGDAPNDDPPEIGVGDLQVMGDTVWTCLSDRGREWRIGVRWGSPLGPADEEIGHLRALLSIHATPMRRRRPRGAAETVQAHIEELKFANERMRTVRRVTSESIAQMADGVLVVSTLGQVVMSNPRASLYLTGRSDETVTDRPITELLASLNIESGEHSGQRAIRRVMLDRQRVNLNARSLNGRDLLVSLAPLIDTDDRMRGFVMNLSDISRLRQSERRRAEMVSFLSHDLRSPLTSALAIVELSREEENEQALREGLDRIEAHARRTLSLTDGFLELARAEDATAVHVDDVDIGAVAQAAVEDMSELARTKQAQVTLDVTCGKAVVRGDEKLLRRVFSNLIGNALKYGPDKSLVRVEVAHEKDEYVARVIDRGPGIAPDDQRRLFNRFERLQPGARGGPSGIGLGLAFVKAVAEMHGGRVELESRLGEGSTFSVYLAAA